MEFEVWRDVVGFEEQYKVSDMGRVLSVARLDPRGCQVQPRILRESVKSAGHRMVCLSQHSRRTPSNVHRLVGIAFIPNPLGLPEINHKNLTPSDNRVCNLEWCTHAQNMHHAAANGVRFHPLPCLSVEEKKRRKAIYGAAHRLKNKDRLRARYQENKEGIRAQQKEYRRKKREETNATIR